MRLRRRKEEPPARPASPPPPAAPQAAPLPAAPATAEPEAVERQPAAVEPEAAQREPQAVEPEPEPEQPERRRRKADPLREELEEFARGTDEAEPLLMPGPLPPQPALESPHPPASGEPNLPAAPEAPPPAQAAEPAPPAKPQQRSHAVDAAARARPVDLPPAPVPSSTSPPRRTPQAATRPSEKEKRGPRVRRPSADLWRRVGDVALFLLAVAVIAAAVVAVQR